MHIKGGDRMKWNNMLKAAGIAVLLLLYLHMRPHHQKRLKRKHRLSATIRTKDQGIKVSTGASHRKCRV